MDNPHGLYDHLSRWYDWLAASETVIVHRTIDQLGVQPGDRVLEIGCGTGKALRRLVGQVGPEGRVLGVDLSWEMVRRSARRLARDGIAHAQVARADAAWLSCPCAGFDAALMTFTLELFPPNQMTRVLAEVRRILCSGGRFGCASLLETPSPGWMEHAYGWFHHHFPRLADCRPIRSREWVEGNGFKIHCVERSEIWGLPIEILMARKP